MRRSRLRQWLCDGGGGVSVAALRDDALYRTVAEALGWRDRWASHALRMVDALRSGDYLDVGVAGRGFRDALSASGIAAEPSSIVVALAVMRAQQILSAMAGEEMRTYTLACRSNAQNAKERDLFPWRLLDG